MKAPSNRGTDLSSAGAGNDNRPIQDNGTQGKSFSVGAGGQPSETKVTPPEFHKDSGGEDPGDVMDYGIRGGTVSHKGSVQNYGLKGK